MSLDRFIEKVVEVNKVPAGRSIHCNLELERASRVEGL